MREVHLDPYIRSAVIALFNPSLMRAVQRLAEMKTVVLEEIYDLVIIPVV